MKIIFIHGMNQQNYNAESLKQHWIDILQQGIDELKLPISTAQLDIRLAFYGDLISKHQLSNRFDLESFLPKSWVNFHFHKHTTTPATTTLNVAPAIPILPYFMPEHDLKLSKRLYLASQLLKDNYKCNSIKLKKRQFMYNQIKKRNKLNKINNNLYAII